ncbi:MAG: peptidylprolyl isomerase [Hyphomonadaceae bacterium]
MKRTFLAACAMTMFCTIAAAQDSPLPEGDLQLEGVATLVNDEPISFHDIRQRVRMLAMTVGAEITPETQQQLANTAREQLVDEILQMQAVEEFSVEVSDSDVNNSISDLAQRTGITIDDLYTQFAAAGINPSTLEAQTRADIAWRRMMSGLYGSRIRISQNQLDSEFEQMRASSQETAYQLSEIFLFAPDEESKVQALEAAYSLVDQLRQGAPFHLAAGQFSSASTSATGGDMGWVALRDLNPVLAENVVAWGQPGIMDPIVVSDGVHILALRNRREPQPETSRLELHQLIATDGNIATLERAMNRVGSCTELLEYTEDRDGLLGVDLGTTRLSDLADAPQALLVDLESGDTTVPFEMSAGWASLYVCKRTDGAEGLPSRDQIENQLFGEQLGLISERELRNARREATILVP